jgi:hypothetical protein
MRIEVLQLIHDWAIGYRRYHASSVAQEPPLTSDLDSGRARPIGLDVA